MADPERVTDQSELAKLHTSTLLSVRELLANLIDLRGGDGSRAPGALDYLKGIAANSAWAGVEPIVKVIHGNDTTKTLIAPCPGDSRIVLLSLFVSTNGAANFSFTDEDGDYQLNTFYTIAGGQGFTFQPRNGLPLEQGKDLNITASAAVTYSVLCSYGIIK